MSKVKTFNALPKVVSNQIFQAAITLLALPILSLPYSALAQESNQSNQYQIEDFSDDYYATIKDYTDKQFSELNYIIEIIDAKTKKTLIAQPSSLTMDYELQDSASLQLGGKLSANIVNIPYGDSSVLIYDDFNFDNKNDLALKDGRYGCYGGPSYQVYLKKGHSFVHSEEFTELAQGNCGFFDIDYDRQTLSTMTKSGAAWHKYSTYKVINNKPVAIRIVEEEYQAKGLLFITQSTRVNGKMRVDNYQALAVYDPKTDGKSPYIYTFHLDNEKIMVLASYFVGDSEQLYYVFANKEGRVELYYDGPFIYDTKQKTLSFTNKPVLYQVNKQGITVKLPHSSKLLKSRPISVQGSLDSLAQYTNVTVK